MKNILSFGWRSTLDNSGNKYAIFKIHGIIDNSHADQLLQKYSFNNNIIEFKIIIHEKEIISGKSAIELYERYYESSNFDNFNVMLISSEEIIFSNY
ncbi:MAG: phage tail tube protein [Ehrlichia sp.]